MVLWQAHRSEVRKFQYVLLQAIDWLVEALYHMNVNQVGIACQKRDAGA